VDKVHYNFVTRELFEEKIKEGGFFLGMPYLPPFDLLSDVLEYTEYNGNLYGIALPTVKAITDSCNVCVMDLDITGIVSYL
jgi:guanylate kinase